MSNVMKAWRLSLSSFNIRVIYNISSDIHFLSLVLQMGTGIVNQASHLLEFSFYWYSQAEAERHASL
jgi:hypothetical protein